MNKSISVPLPLNVTNDNLPLFQPYTIYKIASQKIKILKDVFVTNTGFCMNKKGLIKECHHSYSSQYNDYLNEASHFYYDVVDHPENLITLDDDRTYLAIHHPWFNYYHWICESIFRLWLVRHQLDTLILVLPEAYEKADFIVGSLEPFKIKNIFFIPQGKSLMVRNLCLPQIKPVCDTYNSRHIKQVRDFYTNYVLLENPILVEPIERLYVSREFIGRRGVVNEAELVVILKKYGFTIFHPEQISFLEQVAVFSRVKYLVGMHGSGLTDLLFMGKGTSLLELHKSKTNELDHPGFLFWYMAEALGIKYYHQVCETHGKEDYFEGEYLVDVELFEQNLNLMLSGEKPKT